MYIPKRSASATEILDFLDIVNKDIYRAIYEKGNYRSLMYELIELDAENYFYNFHTAMKTQHISKLQIYAGTRNVTHEFHYVYDCVNFDMSPDMDSMIQDLFQSNSSVQERIVDCLEETETSPETVSKLLDYYINHLDKLINFSANRFNGYVNSYVDFVKLLDETQNVYNSTINAYFLPISRLSKAEQKLLRTTTDSQVVIELITKILESFATPSKVYKSSKAIVYERVFTEGTANYSINKHLEDLGIYRKQYYRYLTEGTTPKKYLALCIALFIAPSDFESIEEVMNIFGYSLKSPYMYSSHRKQEFSGKIGIYDYEMRELLNSGLDLDLIKMEMMVDMEKVKKSKSTPNFS